MNVYIDGIFDLCKEAILNHYIIIVITNQSGIARGFYKEKNRRNYDIEKLLAYLTNTDAVIGTRQIQVLTEKGNQNSVLHVWGNFILAKVIQFKYFSLLHMGIVSLTDVGCLYRLMRREALEKIVDELLDKKTGAAIGGVAFPLYLTMKSIEEDQRFVEVPVTFKKRIGQSKTGTNKKSIGIKYGLTYLWFILRY